MSAIGLVDSENNIYESIQEGTAFPLDEETPYQKMLEIADGEVAFTSEISSEYTYVVVDAIANPTERFGIVTFDGDSTYTYTKGDADTGETPVLRLGDADATLTSEVEATVKTSEGTATYTVNGVAYTANGTELEIAAADETSKLANGSILVSADSTEWLTTSDETATVEGTDAQVLIEVADGAITSITGMGEGEIVHYNGSTYQLFGDVIKVIAEDGSYLLYSGQDEATNIVTLGEDGDMVYIPYENDQLVLATGIAALSEGKRVVYGPADEYEGEYAVEITSDGTYVDASASEGLIINASEITDEVALTTDFTAQVLASTNISVNGVAYVPEDSELTIDAADETSTLYNGTVKLTAGEAETVIPSSADSITVTATNGDVTAKVEDGVLTEIGGLDADDEFTAGESSYKMAEAGLISGGKIFIDDSAIETVSVDDLDTENTENWITRTALDGGALDLTTLENDEDYAIVDSLEAPTARYGTVTKVDNAYTVESEATEIEEIKLGEEESILTTSLEVKVTTAGGSATYTINETAYTANNSELEINVTADGTALNNGTVLVEESVTVAEDNKVVEVADDADGIIVTAEDGVVTSITDLEDGVIVTYDEKTYAMYGTILKVTDADGVVQLYSDSNEETNLIELAEEGDLVYIPYEDGKLNLAAGIEYLSAGKKVYYGSADDFTGEYEVEAEGDGSYTLKAAEGVTPDTTIDASGVTDEIAITTEFETKVETAEGSSITVNEVPYTAAEGSALTIDATTETSTLNTGTVTLDADGEEVTSTEGQSVAYAAGDGVNVVAEEGTITTVAALGEDDSFTVTVEGEENTYTMTAAGLITGETIWTGDEITDEVTLEALAGENWTAMIAVDGDSAVDLSEFEGDSAVIVDSVEAPTARYGTVAADGTAFTIEITDEAVTGVKLGAEDATLTVTADGEIAVTTKALRLMKSTASATPPAAARSKLLRLKKAPSSPTAAFSLKLAANGLPRRI